MVWPTLGSRTAKEQKRTLSLRTHQYTHPFNGPLSGTTRVSQYQKGKTNLNFTEARDSDWQWHQLGHMQVCTSLQTNNHASTPPLSFLQAGCPSCRPTNSVKALKASTDAPIVDHKVILSLGPVLADWQRAYIHVRTDAAGAGRDELLMLVITATLVAARHVSARAVHARVIVITFVYIYTQTHRHTTCRTPSPRPTWSIQQGTIYKISYHLSQDDLKFIVKSTYDSDLKRVEISLGNIVS